MDESSYDYVVRIDRNSVRPSGGGFRYDYLMTNLQCKRCGREFPHTHLRYGIKVSDNKYGISNHRVCPHCGEWNCCSVCYEYLPAAELEKLASAGINQVVISY